MNHSQVHAIEVDHLSKRFGEIQAVKDVRFFVREKEVFGFLGPNGAGKTTTIRMLTTMLQPTHGTARITGFDIRDDQNEVRSQIGMVFQEPSLDLQLTAEENLRFHGWLYNASGSELQRRIDLLLDLVELKDRKKDLVEHFSGGMKRRLEIARGLVHRPRVYFLDEPTIGLDPQTRNKIWEYLLHLSKAESITLFMTTHYMDEAEFCDRVAIMDHGEIVAIGTPEELKQRTGQKSLNDVFLHLTGRDLRDEQVKALERGSGLPFKP